MLKYEKVIESSKAYKIIKLDASENRVSHAYLFVSQDENYLLELIKQTASLLINLNEKEENVQNNFSRINAYIHPDVIFYGKEDETINVDVVSKIFDQAQVCPFEADKKIFVLINVQDMNEICQNKILKTLEEPPENTFFLIGVTGTSRILPTILSRVKQIEVESLSFEKISEMLIYSGIDKNNAQIISICSNGNSTFAEKLAKDKGFIKFFDNIVSCFYEIKGSKDVLKFSSIFNMKNIDKNEFFDIAILISHDLSMILAGKNEFVYCKNILTKLNSIANSLNLNATTTLISQCLSAKKDLIFNANKTAVIDEFLFKIAEVKVICRRLLA